MSVNNYEYVHVMARIRIRIRILLGIRLMTFIHQDLWYGNLVASSHQRGKPSHTILCTFSRGNNRNWKGIPISEWFREEWALVKAQSLQRGSEKSMSDDFYCASLRRIGHLLECLQHPLDLSTKDSVYCLSLLLFFRDSHFSFSSIPVMLPVSK